MERCSELESDEYKRKYFLLFKWMILHNIKGEQFDLKMRQIRKMVYAANFVKLVKALPMLKQVALAVKQRKQFVRR